MDPTTKAGRYHLQEQIGGGGMGVVFRALDTRLNCRVALKEIRQEHLHDVQYRRRLAQEAHAAAAISHPGIARAFDFIDDGSEAFVVYEFVEGVTLRQRLNETRLTTEEILDIAIKTADALAAAHEQGFIHRDLKPENIMLTPRPDGSVRVKILDFGLTKRVQFAGLAQDGATTAAEAGGITTTGMMIIGTVDYMSPEQLRMEKVDHRADLYSLGLVLYEMATGVNPFRGGDPSSTIAHILTHDPPALGERNPVAPAELDRIVRKCLRKKREERYQSAQDLVVDLTNLRRDLAHPPPTSASVSITPPETPLTIPRGLARALFLVIQAGYLVMYGVTAQYLPNHLDRLRVFASSGLIPPVVPLLCIVGAAFRLYFLSAVGFDYSDSGRLYQRVFPVALILDLIWAASPLLLFTELGWLAWLCVVGLAYLPFSQRSLLYSAYAPRGGKTSGIRAGSPA
jgi:serine/threonine protein kinase